VDRKLFVSAAFSGLAVVAISSPARADSSPGPAAPAGLQIDWVAPDACPNAAQFRRRILGLLPEDERRVVGLQVYGRAEKVGERYRLKLDIRDGELNAHREYEGRTCDEVVGAASIAVALLLQSGAEEPAQTPRAQGSAEAKKEPNRPGAGSSGSEAAPAAVEGQPEPWKERSPGVGNEPPALARGDASELPPGGTPLRERPVGGGASDDPQVRRFRWVLAAPTGTAQVGLLPDAAFGVGAGLGVEVLDFRLLLRGSWFLSQKLVSSRYQGSGAEVWRGSVSLQGCRWFLRQWLSLAPCLELVGQHLVAQGAGVDVTSRTANATWLALGPDLQARLQLTAAWALAVDAGLYFQTSRPQIVILGQDQLAQIALLNLSGNIGVEWIF
jgi:hypothetical protein